LFKKKNNFKIFILIFILLGSFLLLFWGNLFAKNAISYNEDGWHYIKKNENYRAILSFKNALRLNPNYSRAISGLAKAYYNRGSFDESIELYNKILQKNSKSLDALVGMGFNFTQKGNYSLSLKFFEDAQKISPDNLEIKYGISYLYFSMDKILWAKRMLNSIFRISPYHYKSLLLLAKIKIKEKRYTEAKQLVEKAIDSNNSNPGAFILYGEIYYYNYLNSKDEGAFRQAVDSLSSALSIEPENFFANKLMGQLYYIKRNYDEAINYFQKSLKLIPGKEIYYSMAVANEKKGNLNVALKYYLLSLKKSPFDSILNFHLEDFLVYNDYKIGFQARILLSKRRFENAQKTERRSLVDESFYYYRRTLFLNPLNVVARENIIQYYSALNYSRFRISELKQLLKLFKKRDYRDRLTSAIYHRRDCLYYKEGYAHELPPRDVPKILVLNFFNKGVSNEHLNNGEVLASSVNFALGQFGRLSVVSNKVRMERLGDIESNSNAFEQSIFKISNFIKDEKLPDIDYILFGGISDRGNSLKSDIVLMDFKQGIVVNHFSVSARGKKSLSEIALRIAKKIYKKISFKGRILKYDDKSIVVNLGSFDGIKIGDRLVIKKYRRSFLANNKIVKKMFFVVKDIDTLILKAVPEKKEFMDDIDSMDFVYPIIKKKNME